MKSNITRVLATIGIALSASLFSFENNEYEIDQLDQTSFNELFSKDRESIILKFREGATFPLKITASGEIFDFDRKDDLGNVVVKSPFYVLVQYPKDLTEEDFNKESLREIIELCSFRFSQDKTEWKTFGDFASGSLKAGIFTEEDKNANLELSLDMNFDS
ncbi:MAG: hypothetical protein S4CHLAM37_06240 [Chlamydiia bacterium]|nr:hypothetical protein [Chlamydiia bacterium]